MPLVKKEFTSNGSWTAPAGVTEVIVIGYGGGASGSVGCKTTGSGDLQGGPGGGGSIQSTVYCTVTPNTTYTVTIGAGGSAVTSTNAASGTIGNDGNDTTFGSLATFAGAGCGYNGENTFACGGISVRAAGGTAYAYARAACYNGTSQPTNIGGPGFGGPGSGYNDSFFFPSGSPNPLGYAGGTAGATSTRYGGGGGGGGPGGAGGNGSAGSTGTSSAGGSAAANTGAGGGGSGAANTNTGNSGAGGSGKLWVIWVEG